MWETTPSPSPTPSYSGPGSSFGTGGTPSPSPSPTPSPRPSYSGPGSSYGTGGTPSPTPSPAPSPAPSYSGPGSSYGTGGTPPPITGPLPDTTNTAPVIDPAPQFANTPDGPAGGDPEEFEDLTGVSSDWELPEPDSEESGGGSVDESLLGGLGFFALLRAGIATAGTGLSAGLSATALAFAAMFTIRPVGEGSDIVPQETGTGMNSISGTVGLDVGGEAWGRQNGIGATEGRRRAHNVKNRDPMSSATDNYRVDPETGDVYDPEGEYAGNLEDDYD